MFRFLQIGYLLTLLVAAFWLVHEIAVIDHEEQQFKNQLIPALDSYSIIENIQIPVGELREKVHQYKGGGAGNAAEIRNAIEVVNSRFYILTDSNGPLSKTFSKPETKVAVRHAFGRFEKIAARINLMLAGNVEKDLVITDLTDFRLELTGLNSLFYTEQINNYSNMIGAVSNVRGAFQRVVAGWFILSSIFALFVLFNQAIGRHLIRQKAEALRRKHVFIAMFNHEIRNPLQGISAAAENLTFVVDDTEILKAETPLDNIRSLSEKISKQVELIESRLLMFGQYSRLESGKVSVVREDLNIEDFVASIVGDYVGIANRKNINLTFEVAKNVGVLHLDRNKTDQILRNLVENAIKYTAAGEVRVSVSIIVKYRKSIRIDVRDTGMGVAKEDLKIIFNPFVKRSEARERYCGGSVGLGLTIVELLVRTLGGHIEVQSEEALGTVFTVEFPV
ncbi:sensor histidine kinase [Paraburkholderia humisilvae]|uniref:histidine kinase n=1 Tax=Paraburkholderia humisilvae TaxID=627669 RepID=A0A6J5F476_9BURK|nr:HAMP domain-containing sensor histidine kinase [Paraburkholderia humisilvae]CAB3772036.1 Sensor histidine kinase RcsC [Paraburkholderia humisilvae]